MKVLLLLLLFTSMQCRADPYQVSSLDVFLSINQIDKSSLVTSADLETLPERDTVNLQFNKPKLKRSVRINVSRIVVFQSPIIITTSLGLKRKGFFEIKGKFQ